MIVRRLFLAAALLVVPWAAMAEPRGSADTRNAQASPVTVSLRAVFANSAKPIRSGLEWRIFSEAEGESKAPLFHSADATPRFQLHPGNYIIHVSYGLAAALKPLKVGNAAITETLQLAAGGLVLDGAIGDAPITDDQLRFTIYAPLNNQPEGRLVAQNIRPNELVRLPEGSYHIISKYGGTNAIRRADIRVEVGVVTKATLHHRAATMTLKLVLRKGGEALAGTAFTVLTPGGDTIHEAIGAFPQVILAEGEYLLNARNGGKVYTGPFTVESGRNTDAEVLAD